MRCVLLGLFAVLAYTTAMCYQPEPDGYTPAQVRGLSRLIARAVREPNPGASRRDINALFGREDVR